MVVAVPKFVLSITRERGNACLSDLFHLPISSLCPVQDLDRAVLIQFDHIFGSNFGSNIQLLN